MMETMDRGSLYEHDIPSLSASLEAFDPERSTHSIYSTRSNMHSSRWSVPPQEQEESEAESDGPWQPPAWQRSSTNRWFRKSLLSESPMRTSQSRSPGTTPFDYRNDREITPSRIPLPESPSKGTPRTSPEPVSAYEKQFTPDGIASRMQSPSEETQAGAGAEGGEHSMELSHHEEQPEHLDGFVRFAIRGETLFRTAPIEDTISSFAGGVHMFTRSKLNVIAAILFLLFSWVLVQPWSTSLIPDVANVANMAKQFEPLMYASENVIPRSRELAEASIAVQDLGESVRATNMSASTVIIDQLDDLGESLKMLSEKITSFFTNVDGDMDSILITMEWARRELQSIQGPKIGMLDRAIGNIHGGLSRIGLLETSAGEPTTIGNIVNDVLGHTTQQRSKATLQRTFDYLLTTLEENIASELTRADILFQLFESVDRQFHNLHRSVAKEEDSLATRKDEFLASMWRNTINNKMKIKKYEKNLKLLKDVRASTLANKSDLKSNIQIIHSVKDQLDKARKNLISPLIRRAQSNSFGLEQQLNDLTGTYGFLKELRDTQKHKVRHQLWASPEKRVTITTGKDDEVIEGY
ncbi:hypothetical protein CC80DRAFT_53854 [Byssothecium circinans]|uniref:Uncharacterized protein n=1 Tax=Byssothecium circinans TaxID=147558 RepID=A0A6A5TWN3_9PLEO|nr:hypothetical protein CC80DRAFT_53854 [Byssothecium circinans]